MHIIKGGLNLIVGRRISKLRIDHNWRQRDLAERLNISPASCCKLERGQIDFNLSRLIEISDILHIEITELLKYPGELLKNPRQFDLRQTKEDKILLEKDKEIESLKLKITRLRLELEELVAKQNKPLHP